MVQHDDIYTANFDLICTLPLSTDLIALAAHPTRPLLVVGFASGYVQAYKLPEDSSTSANTDENNGRKTSLEHHPSKAESNHVKFSSKFDNARQKSPTKKAQPRRSSLASSTTSPPPNGHAMIETVWRTRRHKGSCRALAFSTDGMTLFSAGTDGIIKAADAETGKVVGKTLIPTGRLPVHPSRLLALNPRCLLLGDDEGGVHEYELEETPFASEAGETRHAPVGTQPKKTQYPHRTEGREKASDPITSLTALPPSGASTSKICRSWISTAGSTVAVSDAFRGVVACSDEQGAGKEPLEMLSCACLTRKTHAKGDPTSRSGQKAKKGEKKDFDNHEVVMIIGDSSGGCSNWPRGQWQNRTGHTNIRRNIKVPGLPTEDFGVECVAIAPPCREDPHPLIVAGLAIGRIHFLRYDDKGRLRILHSEYPHDDQGLDGCNAVVFDAQGRMISGGGAMVKIWRRKFETSEVDVLADIIGDEPAADTPESDDDSGEDILLNGVRQRGGSDEDEAGLENRRTGDDSDDELGQEPKRKRKAKINSKKRKRGRGKDDGRGDHGILKVKGLI
ncbi:MAG: hypothetical protein Q9162_004272 [Coniocarpon cinnabarinum]